MIKKYDEYKIKQLIESIPDSDDPSKTQLMIPVGDKMVFIESWCDRCYANLFDDINIDDRSEKVDWARNQTEKIVKRQKSLPQNQKKLQDKELVDYYFVEFPENEVNFGASIGIFQQIYRNMIHYLTYIKDVIGNNYLGIKVNDDAINPFLNELKSHLGDDYDEFVSNKQKRDRGSNHITVINVMDYNKLGKKMGMSNFINSLEMIFKYPIDDLKMMGLGTAKKNENQTFFVVCKSEKLDAIRERYNLPPHDFHITLGFKYKDVFGVRKNEVMDKKSDLLKLLSQKYLERENFEFLKKINNWNEDPQQEIIPIKLSETTFKVKVGDKILGISIVEGDLRVVYRYNEEKEEPRIPTTELIKILKNN